MGSGHSSEDLSQMNVDAYFDKPLEPRALLAKVVELLAARGPAETANAYRR